MAKEKLIETPERMLELFEAYKKEVKGNPFEVKDWVGKDGDEVKREKEKPLTMEGFECHVFNQGLNGELSHYFSNKDNRYADYVAICSRIRKEIRRDQIEGGMASIYNPSITQRLNGLTEKTENKNENTNIEVKAEFGTSTKKED
jgi:lantibiotic modifying enzyme